MIKWAQPDMLLLLWGVPPLVAGLALAGWRRRRALSRIVPATVAPIVAPGASRSRRSARASALLGAIALVIVALARPQHSPQERQIQRQGRDIAILLDVSRSMLARDLAPDRLERAKLWIGDLLGSLRGDRVALIAFAGSSVIKAPLTTDYGFVRLALDELSPESVSRGGTLIGDAIRTTLNELFDEEEGRQRDIILITDGDDQESFPLQAAAEAGERGVRIIAIGIGDPQGAVVPGAQYQGERVVSSLNPQTLRDIAAASRRGADLPVGAGAQEHDRINADRLEAAEPNQYDDTLA
ncbi:MAG: VWA domain-containing protein, partial [Phycisphaerales bacterium JB039]